MSENNINEHERVASANTESARDERAGTRGYAAAADGAQTSSGGDEYRSQEYRSSQGTRQSGQGFQRNATGVNNKRGTFRRPFKREKYDKIAAEKMVIDYKQPEILRRFLTERGKILSRYITGNSAKNQRRLVREIKRARFVGLLPSA